jgi:hypothetical protein
VMRQAEGHDAGETGRQPGIAVPPD